MENEKRDDAQAPEEEVRETGGAESPEGQESKTREPGETGGEEPEEGKSGIKLLELASLPGKLAYRPGEEIDYAGLRVLRGEEDVTDHVEFSVKPKTVWGATDKKVEVHIAYTDESGHYGAVFELKRKRRIAPLIAALLSLLLIAGVCAGVWWYTQPKGDTGSYIIPQGNMTDEEAQKLVDEQAEKSRITVSMRPKQELKSDGALHINFVVVEGNNGFSERLEVAQDGNVVYKSGIVKPGNMIEWGASRGAHAGPATVTVYAVDGSGNDSGNPVSVEIEIIEDK